MLSYNIRWMAWRLTNRVSLLVTCLLLLLFSCCKNEKERVKSYVEEMKATPVSLCLNQMECRINPIKGKRTPTYRMVVYVDSAECSSCALGKLRFWNPLIQEAQDKKIDIDYIFILAPKPESMDDINMELEITDLQSSIYLDTAYVFKKRNPAIPKETKYHSFLLDKKGNVQFVGSPIDSEKIKNVYYKALGF